MVRSLLPAPGEQVEGNIRKTLYNDIANQINYIYIYIPLPTTQESIMLYIEALVRDFCKEAIVPIVIYA
jgi:hypothetical protein